MLTNSEILYWLKLEVEELKQNHSISSINYVYGMLVMAMNSEKIDYTIYTNLLQIITEIAIKNDYELSTGANIRYSQIKDK